MAITPPSFAGPAASFAALCELMAKLRGPGGCPWDRKQTLASLRPYLIEEAYEVLEALDADDAAAHCEELGDLLLQVVFQAELRREAGQFDIGDVARSIENKLRTRHPHIFADAPQASSAAEALQNWERQKAAERGDEVSRLAGLPRALPALLRACRVHDKAAAAGFDWPDAEAAEKKFHEEWQELQQARQQGDQGAIQDEFGDVLMSLCSLGRQLGIDAEDALRQSVDKFTRRFQHIEVRVRQSGGRLPGVPLAQLEAFWQEAKRAEDDDA